MKDDDGKTETLGEPGKSSDSWLWLLALSQEVWILGSGAIAILIVALFALPQERTGAIFWVVLILVFFLGSILVALILARLAKREKSDSRGPGEPPG
jgi:membrane protein implicated in regulation of membrane protease activity